MNEKDQGLLKSKMHFEILDGLRGVAALAVVVFHFMEWVYTDYSKNFIGHGFLAVDFFFCLSGFVIAYAYDDRIAKLGTLEFLKSRMIRLHPLVILGSVLGLAGLLFDPFGAPLPNSPGSLAVIFVCSLLLVPYGVMESRGYNLFGLNAPAWSLFWEYVANILYAVVLHRASRPVLICLMLISAIALCAVNVRAGNLMGGWGRDNFWDGGVRIAYSFSAGMFVYRSDWIIKNQLGFLGLSVLLSLAFLMPYSDWNWLTESIIVIVYFPLLISLGAGARLSTRARSLCRFSGNISYPLYMTHYAGIWIFASYFNQHKSITGSLVAIIMLGTVFLVGFGWLAMVLYDIPVRKYLQRMRLSARSKGFS